MVGRGHAASPRYYLTILMDDPTFQARCSKSCSKQQLQLFMQFRVVNVLTELRTGTELLFAIGMFVAYCMQNVAKL